jgi:hypothetical protein
MSAANRDDFPKVDPYCHVYTTGHAPLCTLDAHPYAADMHDAARSASRGDGLSRSAWDPNALPPAYKKAALQLTGRRALLALADTATAARFSLNTASLQNKAGKFVAPTDASILLGQQAMTQSGVTGVLASNPNTSVAGAYPLVNVTYAVTAPTALTQPEANDYANLVRYAVSFGQIPGQNPGQLPDGYVPLPKALQNQALFAAALIQARKGGTPAAPVGAAAGSGVGGAGAVGGGGVGDLGDGSDFADTGDNGGVSGTDAGASTDDTGAGGETADLPADTASGRTLLSSSKGQQVPAPIVAAPAGARTPSDHAGLVRYALIAALVLGSLAAAGGPALPLIRRRIRR